MTTMTFNQTKYINENHFFESVTTIAKKIGLQRHIVDNYCTKNKLQKVSDIEFGIYTVEGDYLVYSSDNLETLAKFMNVEYEGARSRVYRDIQFPMTRYGLCYAQSINLGEF